MSAPGPPMSWDCNHELSRIAPASQGRSLADVPSGKRLQISDDVVRSSFLDHIKSRLALERADWIILDVAKRRCRIVAQGNSGLKYARDVARKFLRALGARRAEVPRCEHVRDGTLGFITEPGQGVDKILLVCDRGAGHYKMVRQSTVAHMPEFAGQIDCLPLIVLLVVAPSSGRSAGSTSRVTVYFNNDLLPQSTRCSRSLGSGHWPLSRQLPTFAQIAKRGPTKDSATARTHQTFPARPLVHGQRSPRLLLAQTR